MECLFDVLELISWILLIVFLIIAIGTEIILYAKKIKKVSELERLFKENKDNIDKVINANYIGVKNAEIRDYFVRNKYIGKLEDKGLIEDYKKEIEDFEEMKNDFLNYRNVDKFEKYKEILTKYEHMQIVLNTYPKKKETK